MLFQQKNRSSDFTTADAIETSSNHLTIVLAILYNGGRSVLSISEASQFVICSVAVDASSYTYQFYSSGIFYDDSCSTNKLNHAMLVVGYGSYNGISYWIVKNRSV